MWLGWDGTLRWEWLVRTSTLHGLGNEARSDQSRQGLLGRSRRGTATLHEVVFVFYARVQLEDLIAMKIFLQSFVVVSSPSASEKSHVKFREQRALKRISRKQSR